MTLLVLALQVADDHPGQLETIAQTFGVDWPHLLAQTISFAIVCAILYRLAYAPILRMLDARRAQIAQGLANTEKINATLADIDAQRQRTMAEARAEATRLITEARELVRRIHQQETERAIAAAEQIGLRAREAAEQEHARMLLDLRREVGRLVAQTTEAVIGRVLTAQDQQRLAEASVTHLTQH
jgi:F-type H+-transporting ATPase subunit b